MTPRERTLAMIEGIALAHRVTVADIFGPSKNRYISKVRFRCYRALRSKGMSLPQIGEFMGRHHTTILEGLIRLEVEGE